MKFKKGFPWIRRDTDAERLAKTMATPQEVVVQPTARKDGEKKDAATLQMEELARRREESDNTDKRVGKVIKEELSRIGTLNADLRDNTRKQQRAQDAIKTAQGRQTKAVEVGKTERVLAGLQDDARVAHETPGGLADTVRQVEDEAEEAKRAAENGTAEMRRQQEALATATRERDEALQKKGDVEIATVAARMNAQVVQSQKVRLEGEITQLDEEKVRAEQDKARAEAEIPGLQKRASDARTAKDKAIAELQPVKEARDKALQDATEAAGALKSTEEEVKKTKQELEMILLQGDLFKACFEVGKLRPAAKAAEDEYRNARQAAWDAGEKVNKATDPAAKTQAEQELTQAKERRDKAETQYRAAYEPYKQAVNRRDDLIEKIVAAAMPVPRVKII